MSAGLGALAGMTVTGGALLIITATVRAGAPGLDRIAPYLPPSALGRPRRIRTPAGRGAVRAFNRQAWRGGGAGAAAALLLGIVLAAGGLLPPRAPVALAVLGGLLGLTVAQWHHQQAAEREREALVRGLPAALDLLSFCVAAGENPQRALARVADLAPAPLDRALARVTADITAGATFLGALREWRERSGDAAVGRFIDVIETALERGAPLAEVLRAQAADIRFAVRASALDRASRQEIGVLIPVVFLVLPSVVLVALYPGLVTLRLVLG